jgi:hypothetical protein
VDTRAWHAQAATALTQHAQQQRRGGASRLVPLALVALSCACSDRVEPTYSASDLGGPPLVGLFVPGSQLGVQPIAASAADGGAAVGLSEKEQKDIEAAISQGDTEDRCTFTTAAEGTAAMLTAEFTTASYGGFYDPENCGAVWIEDTEGHYVATAELWAKLRMRNIFVWSARRCKADKTKPDAVSSATLPNHKTPHTATWDGRDWRGKTVADGSYVLNIEVTEDEFDYGRRGQYPFEKTANPSAFEPDDDVSIRKLKITYSPKP